VQETPGNLKPDTRHLVGHAYRTKITILSRKFRDRVHTRGGDLLYFDRTKKGQGSIGVDDNGPFIDCPQDLTSDIGADTGFLSTDSTFWRVSREP